jgi:tetratricopeptide (TPR) repeat protein
MICSSLFLALGLAPGSAALWQQPHSESSPIDLQELTGKLAPKYIRGGLGPDPHAIRPVLLYLIDGQHQGRQDVFNDQPLVEAFERLWPNLRRLDTDYLVERLLAGDLAHPQVGRDLLEAAPYPESQAALLRYALAEEIAGPYRVAAIGRILEADGRAGLSALRPLLRADTPAEVLRRIYHFWGAMVENSDLELLESLVREGPGLCREFALQTWARVETRPAKRLEIFRLSENSDSSFRSAVVRSLAVGGPSVELSEHLRSMLDAPRPEDRRLAMDVLPYFAKPEVLLEEWRAHRHPNDSLAVQGQWMSRMARLSLPEARLEAAHWLLADGWQEGRLGAAIARSLGQTSEVDPLLGSFLRRQEVPFSLRLQLASDRAMQSPEAADFLRAALPLASALHAVRICQVLGSLGTAIDVRALLETASDPGQPGMARAAAVRALIRCNSSAQAFKELIEQVPLDYETAEALAVALIWQLDPEVRRVGLAAIARGFDRLEKEELRGVRRAAWQAIGQNPNPEEAQYLRQVLRQTLRAIGNPNPGAIWPEPRTLHSQFPDLIALATALAASAPGTLDEALLNTDFPSSSEALFVAAVAAVPFDAKASLAVFSELASRPTLSLESRLRCLGRVAWTAKIANAPSAEIAALERILQILQDPDPKAAVSLAMLGWGMGKGSARGWLLPQDEIWQRLILARAQALPISPQIATLEDLLSGGCQLETLHEAVELLVAEAESMSGSVRQRAAHTAVGLALRAISFEPGRSEFRFLAGRALQLEGQNPPAILQYQHALRLAPSGSEIAQICRNQLQILTAQSEPKD